MLHLLSWQFGGHVEEHFTPKNPGSLQPTVVKWLSNVIIHSDVREHSEEHVAPKYPDFSHPIVKNVYGYWLLTYMKM